MGAFDDLIPDPATAKGAFDDLVPWGPQPVMPGSEIPGAAVPPPAPVPIASLTGQAPPQFTPGLSPAQEVAAAQELMGMVNLPVHLAGLAAAGAGNKVMEGVDLAQRLARGDTFARNKAAIQRDANGREQFVLVPDPFVGPFEAGKGLIPAKPKENISNPVLRAVAEAPGQLLEGFTTPEMLATMGLLKAAPGAAGPLFIPQTTVGTVEGAVQAANPDATAYERTQAGLNASINALFSGGLLREATKSTLTPENIGRILTKQEGGQYNAREVRDILNRHVKNQPLKADEARLVTDLNEVLRANGVRRATTEQIIPAEQPSAPRLQLAAQNPAATVPPPGAATGAPAAPAASRQAAGGNLQQQATPAVNPEQTPTKPLTSVADVLGAKVAALDQLHAELLKQAEAKPEAADQRPEVSPTGTNTGTFDDLIPKPAAGSAAPISAPELVPPGAAAVVQPAGELPPAGSPATGGDVQKVKTGFVPPKYEIKKPIQGPTGAAIVGYEWRSKMGEKWSNREGGYVEGRVSDWDNSDTSKGTGREIVHVFYVKHPDKSITVEGIRSAQNVLGISETRLMTIAKREQAAQAYREEQTKAEAAIWEKAAKPTAAEAARDYRQRNHSPMRSFEENNALFNESLLFEKGGKFVRRPAKATEFMQGQGWKLVEKDPAKPALTPAPESASVVLAAPGTITAGTGARPSQAQTGAPPADNSGAIAADQGANPRRRAANSPKSPGLTESDGLLFSIAGSGIKLPAFIPDGIVVAQYRRLRNKWQNGKGFLSPAEKAQWNRIRALFPQNYEDLFGRDGETMRRAYDAAKKAGVAGELFTRVKRDDGRGFDLDAKLDQIEQATGRRYSAVELWAEIERLAAVHQGGGAAAVKENAQLDVAGQQYEAFQRDLSKRPKSGQEHLKAELLADGARFTMNGVKLRVTDVNVDAEGNVTSVELEDGNKYGTQTVDGETRLVVDKGSLKNANRAAGGANTPFAAGDMLREDPGNPDLWDLPDDEVQARIRELASRADALSDPERQELNGLITEWRERNRKLTPPQKGADLPREATPAKETSGVSDQAGETVGAGREQPARKTAPKADGDTSPLLAAAEQSDARLAKADAYAATHNDTTYAATAAYEAQFGQTLRSAHEMIQRGAPAREVVDMLDSLLEANPPPPKWVNQQTMAAPKQIDGNQNRPTYQALMQARRRSGIYDAAQTVVDYLNANTQHGQLTLFAEGDQPKNLAAVHNTTAEKLRHMMKMGGLPVPSVAIMRPDKAGFDSFGDITLVGNPELVTPSSTTKVLNADAYSPRYPTVQYFPDPKSVTAVQQLVQPTLDKLTGVHAKSFSKFNLFNESPEKSTAAALKDSPEMMLAYLDQTGRMPELTLSKDYEGRYQQGHDSSTVRSLVSYNDAEKPKFEQWVDQQIQRLGLTEKEKIFKGFTNSGNRSYLRHDLDTVVRIMKKGLADAEGFNYGVGSVRATTAKRFRSLESIGANRDKIISKEAMEIVKKEVDEEFAKLEEEANGSRANKITGFGRMDAFSSDLKDMAIGGTERWKYLREQYPGGEPFPAMRAFLEKLKNLPTEYFEAKIQRAVSLSEFTGAVVPDTTPADLIESLRKRGLDVRTYPKGDSEARRQTLQALSSENKVLFATSKGGGMTIETATAEINRLLGTAELPRGIRVVHEPGATWGARIDNRNTITVNAAQVSGPKRLQAVMLEEGLHGVWDDPDVQAAWRQFRAAVTPEMAKPIFEARKRRGLPHDPETIREEAAIDGLLNAKPGLLARLWEAIRKAFRKLFGIELPAGAREKLLEAARRFLKGRRGNLPGRRIVAENAVVTAPGQSPAYALTAYHGTPHKVDRFSTDKIGTGEGAQVYGWGLYFAENPAVAENYRQAFERSVYPTPERLREYYQPGRIIKGYGGHDRVLSFNEQDGNWSVTVEEVRQNNGQWETVGPRRTHRTAPDPAQLQQAGIKNQANTYTVRLRPETDELLDWNKPLSEQSDKVKQALADYISQKQSEIDAREASTEGGMTATAYQHAMDPYGHFIYSGLSEMLKTPAKNLPPWVVESEMFRGDSMVGSDMKASQYLASRGVKGIRYTDQASRGRAEWIAKHPQGGENVFPSKSAAETFIRKNPEHRLIEPKQTHNYVIFDGNDIRITHENGQELGAEEAMKQPQFAGGDFSFDAPESVAEQKARLTAETQRRGAKQAKESMLERADARLTGQDIDTTSEMFGAETKVDKAGQGSLFAAGDVRPENEEALAKQGELPAFHGSPAGNFETFNPSERGIFFTNKRRVAEGYTQRRGMWLSPGKHPRVYDVRLRMKNPLVIDASGKRHNNIPFPGVPWKPTVFGNLPAGTINVEEAARRAFTMGHDGIIIRNVRDTVSPQDKDISTVYAVKSPEQIKASESGRTLFAAGDMPPELPTWQEHRAEMDKAAEVLREAIAAHADARDRKLDKKAATAAKNLAAANYRTLEDNLYRRPDYIRHLIDEATRAAKAGDNRALELAREGLDRVPRKLAANVLKELNKDKPDREQIVAARMLGIDLKPVSSDTPSAAPEAGAAQEPGEVSLAGKIAVAKREFPAQLRGAMNEVSSVTRKLKSRWEARQGRETMAYTFDAANTTGGLFGARTANLIRHELNRAFNAKDVNARNDVREQALTFVVEAGRSPAELAMFRQIIEGSDFAGSLWGQRALHAIDYAQEHFDRLAPVAELYERSTDGIVAMEQEAGVPTIHREGGYVFHMQDAEAGFNMLQSGSGGKATPGTPFLKVREHATYADSLAAGVVPKTLSAVDLMQHRARLGATTVMLKSWVAGFRRAVDPGTQLPFVTDTQPHIRQDGVTYTAAPPGYVKLYFATQELAVLKPYADLFKNLTGESVMRQGVFKPALMKAASVLKHGTLLFDTYHLGRMAFWAAVARGDVLPKLPTYNRGLTLLDTTAADMERMAARGEIPKEWLKDMQANRRDLDYLVQHGLNIGHVAEAIHTQWVEHLPLAGRFNKWLFQKYIRGAMAEAGLIELRRQMNMAGADVVNPQIARRVARDLNVRFGSLGSQGIFTSRTMQDISRLIFLAPQWNEALIRSELGAARQLATAIPESIKARRLRLGLLGRSVGVAILGTFIANQIINWITRGQPTWDNKEEGTNAKISAYIPDVVGNGPGFFLNPATLPAEISHLLMEKTERSGDAGKAVQEYLSGRLGPMGRVPATLMMRTDPMGHPLAGWDVGKQMALSFVPIPISGDALSRAGKQLITGEPEEKYPGQFEKQAFQTFGVKLGNVPGPEKRMLTLAHEFVREHRATADTTTYPESKYYDARNAARLNNQRELAKALDELLVENEPKQVMQAVRLWSVRPFTGVKRLETQFKATLNPEQLQAYEQARKDRDAVQKRIVAALPAAVARRKQREGQ